MLPHLLALFPLHDDVQQGNHVNMHQSFLVVNLHYLIRGNFIQRIEDQHVILLTGAVWFKFSPLSYISLIRVHKVCASVALYF